MPPGHGDGQNHYSPKPVLSLKVPGLASFTVQGGSHENDPGPSNGTSSAEATEDAPEDLRELSRDRVA
eukprot:gene28874-35865_t